MANQDRCRFDAAERLRELELGQARLGVCLLDTVTGEISGNRIDERFAMCSSFKLAMVAAAYARQTMGD
jgi:beta-lactamase class A